MSPSSPPSLIYFLSANAAPGVRPGLSLAASLRSHSPRPAAPLSAKSRAEFARSSKAGPYLSAPLPMAAHLRARSAQSARGSSLCLGSFSERIQLLLGKLPVGAFRFCCFPVWCPPRQGEGGRGEPVSFPHARGGEKGALPVPLLPPRLAEGKVEGGKKSRITSSSGSAVPGARSPSRAHTHLYLHRLESPVSPERLRHLEKGREFIGSNMSQETDK